MHTIALRPDQPFDLDLTLSCGQVFRWERGKRGWTGVVGDSLICIRQEGRSLTFQGADPGCIISYFQLDEDLAGILSSIDRDPQIHAAISRCRGLRIVRQPAWECLASYICATYANIPGIKRRISLLCRCFGDPLLTPAGEVFTFPSPGAIAFSEPCRIAECRLGYRAPYLKETARVLADDPGWEERVRDLPYEKARRELLRLKGVGKKVADCVLLFAFGKHEAFPVDVWIQRILKTRYPEGVTLRTYDQFNSFGRTHFGSYAGYAQEYLFCDRAAITGGRGEDQVPVSQPDR
ncbi:MAG: 8-oxoguanine DNA glycosylase [Methanolinea sp.]|jgi:N-glycosylase/DNA lyase|nr:8-oxoguanine DNA glycosylase [Methanolinea sp.]